MPTPLRTPFSLIIPRRFHPVYSLLGRWLRHRTGDDRQAEAYYLVLSVLTAVMLLLLHNAIWALWPVVLPVPGIGPVPASWAAAPALLVLFAAICLVGFQPAVTLSVHPDALHIRQGRRNVYLPHDALEAATVISARRFHRHYRRYAATHAFVNRMERELVLLRTSEGPVVLGLPEPDRAALLHHLDAWSASVSASSHVASQAG